MRRIRTIKPGWTTDEKLQRCSDAARVLSVGLITLADDYGSVRAGHGAIAGVVWGASLERDPRETLAKVSNALSELVAIGFVTEYAVRGERFLRINGWSENQKVDKPSKLWRLPDISEADEALARPSRDPREEVAPDRIRGEEEEEDLKTHVDKSTPAADAAEARVFDHWVSAFGLDPKRTKLDRKRRAKLRARLKRFTADELCAAIDAYAAQPWRRAERVRHEFATLLRDDAQIENASGDGAARIAWAESGPDNVWDTSDLDAERGAA